MLDANAENGTAGDLPSPDSPPPTPHSPFARVARLARKELSEILRDRRTIVTLVAMPLLLYPILSVSFQQFFLVSRLNPAQGPEYRVGFVNEQEGRLLFARLIEGEAELQRGGAKAGKSPRLQTVTGTPEELRQAVREGTLDLFVRVPRAEEVVRGERLDLHGRDWSFKAEAYFVPGAPAGQGALAYVERRLAAANARDLERRLNLPGVHEATALLKLELAPLEGAGADTFVTLSSLVPLILILMTITGAVYPAIDLTAGERERGTLEVLMAAPVPRFELLSAKYLSVLTVAVLTALVNLAGMAITLQLSGLGRVLLGERGLSLELLVQLFALLLLFAAFFSAVLLSITSFARSFKEAQAYLIPLMLAALAPGVLAMMPGLKLEGILAVLPLVNIVLLARDLFQGGVDPFMAGVVVVTTLLYAAAALSLAARVFGAESVLYSEQSGWSDLLRRADEPRPVASVAAALWCLALAVPLHFTAHGLLLHVGQLAPAVQASLIAGLSVLLFVALPALAAYLGRVDWASGFGLLLPRPLALVAGLLLGLSLWPLLLQLLQWVSTFQERHEQLLQQLQQARQGSEGLLLVAMIVAALTEELFFRGFLFSALRGRAGPVVTITVTALLFGLTHVFLGGALGLERLLPSTLLGLVLGTVCWLSGSVLPGMLLHACHNALLVWFGQSDWAKANVIPPEFLLGGAVGTLAGALVLWVGGRRALTFTDRPDW